MSTQESPTKKSKTQFLRNTMFQPQYAIRVTPHLHFSWYQYEMLQNAVKYDKREGYNIKLAHTITEKQCTMQVCVKLGGIYIGKRLHLFKKPLNKTFKLWSQILWLIL